MNKVIKQARPFVGLNVHEDTLAVAFAEKGGTVRGLGTMTNREESVRRYVKELNEEVAWAACYEAGPTGYTLYWQLTKIGIAWGHRPRWTHVSFVMRTRHPNEALAFGLKVGEEVSVKAKTLPFILAFALVSAIKCLATDIIASLPWQQCLLATVRTPKCISIKMSDRTLFPITT